MAAQIVEDSTWINDSEWFNSNFSFDSNYSGDIDSLFQDLTARSLFFFVCSLLFFFCFFGNLLIVIALLKNFSLHRSFHQILFLNLSIVYLFIGLFCIFPTMLYFVYFSWKLGSIGCKLAFYVQAVCYSAAVWSVTAISLESLVNHFWPQRIQQIIASALAAIWFLSFVLNLPHLFIYQLTPLMISDTTKAFVCRMTGEFINFEAYCTFGFVFWYLIPVVILILRLVSIAYRAIMDRSEQNLNDDAAFESGSHERKLVWLVVASAACFTLTLLPYQVRVMWQTWSDLETDGMWRIFVIFTFLFSYSTSAIHPALYFMLSPSLRRSIVTMLSCRTQLVNQVTESGDSLPPELHSLLQIDLPAQASGAAPKDQRSGSSPSIPAGESTNM